MKLWQQLTRSATMPLALDEWVNYFNYNGLNYPFLGVNQTLTGKEEEIGSEFAGLVHGAYKSNGVVFACMLVRQLLFAEAWFQFRQRRAGRPGDLFGSPALDILERPWPNGTTGDLLTRCIQDADLSGNSFTARIARDRLQRLRPDWVSIVIGSMEDPDVAAWDVNAEVLGYLYQPGGPGSGRDAQVFMRDQVAHFAPIPDPTAMFRGMSWLVPVIREVMADAATTTHKLKFFENGATPNMIISVDASVSPEVFEKFEKLFRDKYEGNLNAFKTLLIGGGANAEVVGKDLKEVDFKATQGAGETRIAAAAGVPPVIVGLSEGLQAATYSNYGQARRRLADGTMRPLWRNVAGSFSTLVPPPADAELWYDDRDIPFLQEDVKDAAEIAKEQAVTMHELIRAGYEPDSVTDAVISGDFSRLKHTGLVSVQLQPPGTKNESGSQNGGGQPQLPAAPTP